MFVLFLFFLFYSGVDQIALDNFSGLPVHSFPSGSLLTLRG